MAKRFLTKRSPLITLRDVTLGFGARPILQRVDWEIRRGDHWAIVGRNGSGKSTLAQALYGGAPVVGGEIVHHLPGGIESRQMGKRNLAPEDVIAHVSFDDQKRLIGNQSSYYQSRWNSIENGKGHTAADLLSDSSGGASGNLCEKARSGILRQLGIRHLLDRKIVHLSNGEMRKLLLAQALLRSPLLLILDEPFGGLDRRSRHNLKGIISHLTRRMESVLFVTSRPDEIPDGITHALWLENGAIAAAGEKDRVLQSLSRKATVIPPKQVKKTAKRRPRRKGLPEPPSLIEMKKVSVAYGNVEVLKAVDWSIREGEHWALVGPNGSGKTTLLSLISGDNPQAYANDIRLFGRKKGSGESIWEIKEKIGWMSPEMHAHYRKRVTVFEAVCSGFFDSIGLYEQCSDRQRRRAFTVMRDLGLSELAQRNLDSLSAGYQRMALVARALVKRPKLLILDEPCQGLDPENRTSVLQAVEHIGRQGQTTLLYVTHRFDEIPQCVTYVLELHEGRVLKKDGRLEVLGIQRVPRFIASAIRNS